MKKIKKIASFLLAIVMVFTMATSAYAATTTITINGTGTEYKGWRILNATDGGSGKFAYTINSTYTTILQTITGKTAETDIIAYINALGTPDYDTDGVTIIKAASEKIREFADAVYRGIISANIPADKEAVNKVFANVEQGYYLIAETKVYGDNDSHSLVMLDTAGNGEITITSKEEVPTLVKEVKETNDTTGVVTDWQEAGSYDIGDIIPFRLTGTLPSNYGNYTTYTYKFHDKLANGLTLTLDNDTHKPVMYVYIDDKLVDPSKYTIVTEGLGDDCSFEVVFNNLKEIEAADGHKATADSNIYVVYYATLNEDAVIGADGNLNIASLEYSNNPYGTGTGKTPEDKVIIFTFDLVVNKTDGTKPLEGAGFTLYKNVNGTLTKIGEEITGVTTFEFKGLDCGKYELVETTVPAGYNKVPALVFTIEPTYTPGVNLNNNSTDVPTLSNLVVKNAANEVISGAGMTFTVILDPNGTPETDGTLNTTVVNNSGTELPSTGGMGTTIFTVGGIGLMVLATVLFVTKRKVSEEE